MWCGQPGEKRIKGQISFTNVRCKTKAGAGEDYCKRCIKSQENNPEGFCGNIYDTPPEFTLWQDKKMYFYGMGDAEDISMPKPHDKHSNRYFMPRSELPWFNELCESCGFVDEDWTPGQ